MIILHGFLFKLRHSIQCKNALNLDLGRAKEKNGRKERMKIIIKKIFKFNIFHIFIT